jgi:hypothetical protein
MIQVPVEGNLLERGIVHPGLLIEPGRCKIADKPSKARYNDAIVTEQQFPDESFDIQNMVYLTADKIRS